MQAKKRIVLKVGTATLTQNSPHISKNKIEDIAQQICDLKEQYEIILVSSGAIAAAHQFFNNKQEGKMEVKQALAAIGQLHLMRLYYEVCKNHNVHIAQCLLTYHDFNDPQAQKNIRNTIETLLRFGYTPIINENDTVATDEIKFGDNDKLAALTAILSDATLLVLATDTDGVYNKDPKIYSDAQPVADIQNLIPYIQQCQPTKSSQGSGGMKSKLEAALIVQKKGIPTWIVNGSHPGFLSNALGQKIPYTIIST